MKILGLILIITSSALCGMSYIGRKKERLDELDSFSLMLELMKGELTTKLRPIPALAESLGEKLHGSASGFMSVLGLNLSMLGEMDLAGIWRESLCACVSELSEKEIDCLISLGCVLGRYDTESQTEAIDSCLFVLRSSRQAETLEFPQLKRLYLGVSVSAGALLAILLV